MVLCAQCVETLNYASEDHDESINIDGCFDLMIKSGALKIVAQKKKGKM